MSTSEDAATRSRPSVIRSAGLIVILSMVPAACETDASGRSDDQPHQPPAKAQTPERPDTGSTRAEMTDTGGEAVELRLTRPDIKQLYSTLRDALSNSEVATAWRDAANTGSKPLVTVAPFRNDVGGSISTSVTSLTSRLETFLVNDIPVDVADFGAHAGTYRKLAKKHDTDDEALFAFGREIGLDHVVTGTLSSDRDLTPETGRITYTVILRVVDVEGGDTAWKTSTTVTKGPEP